MSDQQPPLPPNGPPPPPGGYDPANQPPAAGGPGTPQPGVPLGTPPFGPPPPNAPGYGVPLGPPAAKRGKAGLFIGLVVGAVVLLCLCGGAVAVFSGAETANTGSPSESGDDSGKEPVGDSEPEAGTVGKPVRDGKFEFVVKKVKCGVKEVGDETFGTEAQGQFCLVTLSIKNIGDEAQIFFDDDQKAYGSDGKEFSADSEAGIWANENADVFLNEINPGNTVKGVLVFDIPKKAELAKLELHDSSLSGGVTVAL